MSVSPQQMALTIRKPIQRKIDRKSKVCKPKLHVTNEGLFLCLLTKDVLGEDWRRDSVEYPLVTIIRLDATPNFRIMF